MSLKFRCKSCGEDIITAKALRRGHPWMCRECGAVNIIPESAVETDEEPTLSKQIPVPEVTVEPSFLGPRRTAEIINELLTIYRRNFGPIIGISIIGGVPLLILNIFVLDLTQFEHVDFGVLAIRSFLLSTVLAIPAVIIGSLMGGAMFFGICDYYLGRNINVRRCYYFSIKRAGQLIGSTLLRYAVVGSLAWTVVGSPFAIFFLVSWLFCVQAAMLEGAGPVRALSRSRKHVKEDWWRVFGIFLLLLLATSIAVIIPYFVLIIVFYPMAVLMTPIIELAYSLIYFDLRVRKEGYNPEMLQKEMEELTGEYIVSRPDAPR